MLFGEGGTNMALRVQLFGEFRVWRDHEELTPTLTHLGKPKLLLKILITRPGRIFLQDELIELLWPEMAPQTAAVNLRKRISELRKVLEPELARGSKSQYILTRASGYCFNPKAPYTTDAQEFLKVWKKGQKLEQEGRLGPARREYEAAAALVSGDYLAEDRYEEWAIGLSNEWEERYLSLLEQLGECEAQLGRFHEAIARAHKGLTKQPWRERFYEQWMLYAYLYGEQAQALKAYEECVRLLKEHLRSSPSPRLKELHEQIVKGRVVGIDRYRIPKRPRRRVPLSLGRLPFVGRESELDRLIEQFETACAGHAWAGPRTQAPSDGLRVRLQALLADTSKLYDAFWRRAFVKIRALSRRSSRCA